MILRDVVEGNKFLSLSSEQITKLIASEELKVPSEEKVGELKLIIVIGTLALNKEQLNIYLYILLAIPLHFVAY